MARFLHRVRLENFKSIAHCDVELRDLTFLVGPNGAGKSNFLDALRLLSGAVKDSLPRELARRNGIATTVRRRADRLEIGVVFEQGEYAVSLSASEPPEISEGFSLIDGSISYTVDGDGIAVVHHRRFPMGEYLTPLAGASDDFFLSDLAEGNPFVSQLASCRFYAFIPDHIHRPELSVRGASLEWDGRNLASILFDLQSQHPADQARINEFLQVIVPDVERVWVLQAGGYDILQFDIAGSDKPFNAPQMSDGTLHALGILTAIFHARSTGVALVGIEEPEAGLHPAAARALREALREVSRDVQVLVTSHSPELLDSPDIAPDSILAVVRENGETRIGPIDDASRRTLEERLFTAGELLRLNQLELAPATG